jgi:L-threonylcarbamoyladenylate synthase
VRTDTSSVAKATSSPKSRRCSAEKLMIIIDYKKSNHKQIIRACVKALKQGKVVVYPTDTSYGLAVDATNLKALKRLYKVKGRDFNKAVSVVVPSVSYAKKVASFNKISLKLVKELWPGALTLVLPVGNGLDRSLQRTSIQGFISFRMPNNKIALDLTRALKKPITATSANVAGLPDCYSVSEIIAQYKNKSSKPNIVINAGKLKKRKPSTLVKIDGDKIEIIRNGPISEKQIIKLTKMT